MAPDPLCSERSAFLDNAAAASNAIEDLLDCVDSQPTSRDEARAVLNAWRLVAEKHTDALASLDRFVLHARELGLDPNDLDDLRRGRVSLSSSLGTILSEVARVDWLLAAPRRTRRAARACRPRGDDG